MSRVEFAPEVAHDFDRIVEHLLKHDAGHAASRSDDIVESINVLARSPLIGRPVRNDLRELVIGRGTRGYIALYRYVSEADTGFVLALRSQKEAGYGGP